VRIFHYIELENFKGFGEKQHIELDHPTVLIGPNNSGKTTAIQAMALWSQAVKVWHAQREGSEASTRQGVAVNRLAIVAVPVEKTRLYWHDARPGNSNKPTYLYITVALDWNGAIKPLRLRFRHGGNDELVYVQPGDPGPEPVDPGLVAYAATLNVHLLYSMSGLQVSETVLVPGYIDLLLGQGRTAEVLRNLCLMVHRTSSHDWTRVVGYMRRLFGVTLGIPEQNPQGIIDLNYQQDGVREALSLGMAGRGFLQILLILTYLFSHKRSVLLIDEPDAHLEILRQKQIYALLRDIANETEGQVVIVTHSESVLEAAVDQNLTLLVAGRVESLASRKDIKNALKHFGTGHYVKARVSGHVLYLEGRTDVDMLRALASRMGHPVAMAWEERANVYFVENNYPSLDVDAALEHVEGGFGVAPKEHFFALRSMLPILKGLAILDNDGKSRSDSDGQGIRVAYWSRYEAENYFITPEVLLASIEKKSQSADAAQADLFASKTRDVATGILEGLVRERVFAGSVRKFETYQRAENDAQRLIWDQSSRAIKLSDFAEEFYRQLAAVAHTPMQFRKGELHQLVALVDPMTIDPEVGEKLDLLLALWSPTP